MTAVYLAPLEGITTYIYRRAVHRFFRDPDKYFTPYLSPSDGDTLLTVREWEEILPENNEGVHVVPQLMFNRADLCLRAIHQMADCGITEVNLNLGCPSGNVTRKRKGAGMLASPDELAHLLDEIYEHSPIPVSLKTRLGMHDPSEFDRILEVLRPLPISELILHPRVRDEFYQGPVHEEYYARALSTLAFPVIANGEMWQSNDIHRIAKDYPELSGVMIGRGLIARPDMLEDTPATPEKLSSFYHSIEEDYRKILPGDYSVLVKLKRIWHYRQLAHPLSRETNLAILQSKTLQEFHELLQGLSIL